MIAAIKAIGWLGLGCALIYLAAIVVIAVAIYRNKPEDWE